MPGHDILGGRSYYYSHFTDGDTRLTVYISTRLNPSGSVLLIHHTPRLSDQMGPTMGVLSKPYPHLGSLESSAEAQLASAASALLTGNIWGGFLKELSGGPAGQPDKLNTGQLRRAPGNGRFPEDSCLAWVCSAFQERPSVSHNQHQVYQLTAGQHLDLLGPGIRMWNA